MYAIRSYYAVALEDIQDDSLVQTHDGPLCVAAWRTKDEVERLERIFSSYDPASDLSRVNSRAGLGPTEVPSELARIAAESLASYNFV